MADSSRTASGDRRVEGLQEAVEREPGRADLRREYGVLLFRRRRFSDAAKQFGQWVRINPRDGEGLLFLARALARLGMIDHARTAATLAASIEDTLPRALRVLGRLAAKNLEAVALLSAGDPEPSSAGLADQAPLPAGGGAQIPLRQKAFARLAADAVSNLIDRFLWFLVFEKTLILRNITLQCKISPIEPLRMPIVLVMFIIFHAILFYLISRPFSGDISYLSAVLGAFIIWTTFKSAKSRAEPFTSRGSFNRGANIKWVHLFLADITWDAVRAILAAAVSILIGRLVLGVGLTGVFRMPDVPLFCFTMALAVFLGAGFGIASQALESKWSGVAAIDHIFAWLLYVTTGVYESYVTIPGFIAPYFKINPLLTLVEYTRLSLNKFYPVGDLTLAYPVGVATGLMALGMALRKWERTTGSA